MFLYGVVAHPQPVGAGSPPAAFTAEAVTFDGTNDYMSKASGLTGQADGKEFTFSCWVRFPSLDAVTRRLFQYVDDPVTNLYFTIHGFHSTNRVFRVQGDNASGTTVLLVDLDGTAGGWEPFAGRWYHMLISCDLATTTYHCYIDDIDETVTPTTITNDNIDFTGHKWGIGDYWNGGAGNFMGDVSEMYFTDEYIDITVEANRRKFISAAGVPVDLGSSGGTPTGTDALLYYKGAASVWNAGTNSGTGGNFTMTGAVADSSNEPVALAPTYNNDVVETSFASVSGSYAITVPTAAEGDLIVVVCALDGTQTVSTTSGYNVTQQTNGGGATVGIFYKIAGASESTTANFSTPSKEGGNFHAFTFNYIDGVTPYIQQTNNTGSGTSNATCGPLDVDTGNLIIHAIALDGNASDDVTSAPTNTQMVSVTNSMASGAAAAGSAYHTPNSDGNFTTNAWGHTSDGWVTMMAEFTAE